MAAKKTYISRDSYTGALTAVLLLMKLKGLFIQTLLIYLYNIPISITRCWIKLTRNAKVLFANNSKTINFLAIIIRIYFLVNQITYRRKKNWNQSSISEDFNKRWLFSIMNNWQFFIIPRNDFFTIIFGFSVVSLFLYFYVPYECKVSLTYLKNVADGISYWVKIYFILHPRPLFFYE